MELLRTEKGNTTVALSRLRELQNTSASSHKTVRPPQCCSKADEAETSLKPGELCHQCDLIKYEGLTLNLSVTCGSSYRNVRNKVNPKSFIRVVRMH